MTISQFRIILLAASLSATGLAGQPTVARIQSSPLPSTQDVVNLESRVLQNPEDIGARVELLQYYSDTAPPPSYDAPARQSVRLQHILYLVEHHPDAAASASKAAYVYRANGPYANAADHDAVRDQWLAAVQGHPRDTAITVNAVRFLDVEDKDDAEQVLRRGIATEPENREIAANLGFLYAMETLEPDLADHATAELEQSSNAIVLAAARTALPNLAKVASGVHLMDRKVFDLASDLSARARQIAPDDPDIQGPMPLIKYFVAAQEGIGSPGTPAASSPTRIRVGESVQAYNLIKKTAPQYPEIAQKEGITGEVRFTAIIGREGAIQNLQLISGHPLLVDAAMQAATTWLYRPTLLNGSPVEVVTTITVSFPAN
jgi:TonB family protein